MASDDLLTIGSFAMLVGLSIPTLRHYDESGVLKPSWVDRGSGYRYYRHDQVRSAQIVRALRAVDLPIDEIRDVLDSHDDEYMRAVLVAHRERLHERAHVLSQQVGALDEYIEKGLAMSALQENRVVMINVASTDPRRDMEFYRDALGVDWTEEKHGKAGEHWAATFGEWPDTFFLMQIFKDEGRAGTVNMGFFCKDLDATYKKALKAGATDVHGPEDREGMPRVAQIKDPSGNDVGLYQS